MLINKRAIRKYLKAKGKMIGFDFFTAVNEKVISILNTAVRNSGKYKIVRAEDIYIPYYEVKK